jgi:hypothetical protein
MLVVSAGAQAPAEQAQQGQAPARRASAQTEAPPPSKGQRGGWDAMGMRGFSVALVMGDLAGAATPDNLPAGAKRALSDMRDFLPYKSYRLLDTHWILCCSSSMSSSVSGRLRGAEEDEYAFDIDVRPANDWSELAVRFNLREAAATVEQAFTSFVSAERSKRMADLMREREEAEKRHAAGLVTREQLDEVKRKIEEQGAIQNRATVRGKNTQQVLNSSFSMKVGETVVIGTSRLKGDKALIALLTAASRGTTPPAERR